MGINIYRPNINDFTTGFARGHLGLVMPVARCAFSHDYTLKLHHLRHSFASLLAIKLVLARHPEWIGAFAPWPRTTAELASSVDLVGSLIKTLNAAVDFFVIPRLLGHSSHQVALTHYSHTLDTAAALYQCHVLSELTLPDRQIRPPDPTCGFNRLKRSSKMRWFGRWSHLTKSGGKRPQLRCHHDLFVWLKPCLTEQRKKNFSISNSTLVDDAVALIKLFMKGGFESKELVTWRYDKATESMHQDFWSKALETAGLPRECERRSGRSDATKCLGLTLSVAKVKRSDLLAPWWMGLGHTQTGTLNTAV